MVRTTAALFIIVPLLNFIGSGGLFVAPVQIVGAAKAYDLTPSLSGALLTGEILCSAIAAMVLSAVARSPNVLELLGIAVLLLATQILSGLGVPLMAFVVLHLVAGLTAGALYAFSLSLAAKEKQGIRMLSFSRWRSLRLGPSDPRTCRRSQADCNA